MKTKMSKGETMNTIVLVISLTATLFFGYMTAFTDDPVIMAYSALCFIGLGGLSTALAFNID
jgi:hypothetical protein